ncbi:hypothetical protein IQ225_09545, partial [Synechocystis salina LEGE 06155]|nr:hypothetical protein [Synechocystis salina LEGE 06155]
MFKPNQDVMRFGNSFRTNSYGMRSEELPKQKNDSELRVLVFGDSVINGGNLTDQSDLATEIVKSKINQSKEFSIANISAGSWGPGNWLAYVKEYGFFNANKLI